MTMESLRLLIPGIEVFAPIGVAAVALKIRPAIKAVRNLFWDRAGNSGRSEHIDDNSRIVGFGYCPPFRQAHQPKDRADADN